jgi:4-hydroxythreonine-4-phosphate dehydrogenase
VAYDIAGKGKADPDSMREAIYMAMDIYRNRQWYTGISSNPLKRYERDRGADVSVKDLKLPEHSDD